MGLSEYRGLIVMVSFISITLILITLASTGPGSLFTSNTSASNVPNPSSPTSYLAFNETNAVELSIANGSANSQQFHIPGSTWTQWDVAFDAQGNYYLLVQKFQHGLFGIGEWAYADFIWYNSNGTANGQVSQKVAVSTVQQGNPGQIGNGLTGQLGDYQVRNVMSLSTLNFNWNTTSTLSFMLTSSAGDMEVDVSFDSGNYLTPLKALTYGGLLFNIQQDWDDRITSLNILSIMSGLFLGQIFGQNTLNIDPTVSYIISITLLTASVYIVFEVVRSLIPFLPGGS